MDLLSGSIRLQWLGANFLERRVDCESEMRNLLVEAEVAGDLARTVGVLVYLSACLAWVGDKRFLELLDRLVAVHRTSETMFFAAALLEHMGMTEEATRHRVAARGEAVSEGTRSWGEAHLQIFPGKPMTPDYPQLRKVPRLDPGGIWHAAQMEAYIEATTRWSGHQ